MIFQTSEKKFNGKVFAIKMFICVVLYSMVLAFNLVNKQDGMWNGPYYQSGNWELSIGRWFIRYWDFLNMGIHVNPFTTVVTLILFILGTNILIGLLEFKPGSLEDYFVSSLFLSNMIVCITISYTYTACIYGCAFFLSMVCVWCIKHSVEKKYLIVTGGVSMAFMMGIYQSYLGCVMSTALALLILMIKNECDNNRIWKYVRRGIFTGITGMILYEFFLHINLFVFKTEMSSYNGAGSISLLLILKNLFHSIKRAYSVFGKYMVGKSYHWNALPVWMMFTVSAVIVILIMLSDFHLYNISWKMILWRVLMLLFPITANITFILAPESIFLEQQTGPMALCVAVIASFILKENYRLSSFGKILRTEKQQLKNIAIRNIMAIILVNENICRYYTTCFSCILFKIYVFSLRGFRPLNSWIFSPISFDISSFESPLTSSIMESIVFLNKRKSL